MNVVLVVNSLAAGGSGRVMSWLAGCLAEIGHEVALVTQSPPESDVFPVDRRVHVLRPGLFTGRWARKAHLPDIALGIRVRRLARRHEADVVVSFIRQVNITVLAGMMGTGVPVVVSERSHPFAYSDLGPVRRRLRPVVYRRAASVVVLSDEIAEQARQGWRLERVTVIPNPAPTPPPDVPATTQRERVVLSVGRLNELKGHLMLVEAWATAEARHHGWRLRIVGDGTMRARIEEAAERLGVTSTIELPGELPDVGAEYLRAPVFVLPSVVEGFPNALLEAMAYGCACVATECPGAVSDMLEGGECGVLVPPGGRAELARAIDELTTDHTRRALLQWMSIRRAGDFDHTKVFERWIEELVAATS